MIRVRQLLLPRRIVRSGVPGSVNPAGDDPHVQLPQFSEPVHHLRM